MSGGRLRDRAKGAVERGARSFKRWPWLVRSGVYVGRLTVQTWKQLLDDECIDRAAALAYTTVLAIVPLLAVSFLVFRMSSALGGAEEQVRSYLLSALLADGVGQVGQYLDVLLKRVNTGALGVTGAAMLIVAATWLFINIEDTLNKIFKVHRRRAMPARFSAFWSLLTLGPLLLAFGIYLQSRFQLSGAGRWFHSLPWLASAFGTVLPVLVSGLLITLLFKLVPNTRVRWLPAIAGGVVAGLLFEVSKGGFNLYVSQIYSASASMKIYGAFALFPIFLLWVYITWLVVLFGAVVAYTIQHLDILYDEEGQRRLPVGDESPELSPYGACQVLLILSWRQWTGKQPLARAQLVRVLRQSDELVFAALKRLIDGGLVMSLEREGEPVYLPARDIGHISLDDALQAYQAMGVAPGQGVAADVTRSLDDLFCDLGQRQREVGGGISFLDLVEAVGQSAFERLFHRKRADPSPEVELKQPPKPLVKSAKHADPDAE